VYQDRGLCANLPLANLTLAGVALTFKFYLPVEIPVASSSGMHVLVQAAGSCMLEIVGYAFATHLHGLLFSIFATLVYSRYQVR